MTHARLSPDQQWIAYTIYNNLDSNSCGSPANGYQQTEIRAVSIDGSQDKRIIAPVTGVLNSNNYWYGSSNDFTYLSGEPGSTKFYKLRVDSSMNLVSGPTEVPVPGTITPFDPMANSNIDKIVFAGEYTDVGLVKSIFLMNLSDSGSEVGLSLGRDHSGATIYSPNIFENDPKISPGGDKVAFMRWVNAGTDGHGWHLFVVPIASPLSEVDISYSHLGADMQLHDTLPEWIDNDTIVFSYMNEKTDERTLYTMKDDGSQRTLISLPPGYLYSDVYPFKDSSDQVKLIISVEKIEAQCIAP